MIRYAIDENSNYVLKPSGQCINVVVKNTDVHVRIYEKTGIYLWPDEGTIILVKSIYGEQEIRIITGKQELVIGTSLWPHSYLRPGTEVAILIPLASAYYGEAELELIRPEWFTIPE